MVVWFRDSVFKRCYENKKAGVKKWNQKVARLYVQRINLLYACTSIKDLSTLPQLHFHPLKGNREGQYAINLDGFWRLIVSFDETMQKVCIEEVSKHYDD
jgi:proteic killer suppression protein